MPYRNCLTPRLECSRDLLQFHTLKAFSNQESDWHCQSHKVQEKEITFNTITQTEKEQKHLSCSDHTDLRLAVHVYGDLSAKILVEKKRLREFAWPKSLTVAPCEHVQGKRGLALQNKILSNYSFTSCTAPKFLRIQCSIPSGITPYVRSFAHLVCPYPDWDCCQTCKSSRVKLTSGQANDPKFWSCCVKMKAAFETQNRKDCLVEEFVRSSRVMVVLTQDLG